MNLHMCIPSTLNCTEHSQQKKSNGFQLKDMIQFMFSIHKDCLQTHSHFQQSDDAHVYTVRTHDHHIDGERNSKTTSIN